jgi:predicted site-specific integrase-resolvase
VSRLAAEQLVTPGQLAALLGVDPRTVARWRRTGLLDPHVVTLGGHHRYPVSTANRMAADRGVGERFNAAGRIMTAAEAAAL